MDQLFTGIIELLRLDPNKDARIKEIEKVVEAPDNGAAYGIALFVLSQVAGDKDLTRRAVTYLSDQLEAVAAGRSPFNAGGGGDGPLRPGFRVLVAKEWALSDRVELSRRWVDLVGRTSDTPGYHADLMHVGKWLLGPPFDGSRLRRFDHALYLDAVAAFQGGMRAEQESEYRFLASPSALVSLAPPAYIAYVAHLVAEVRSHEPEYDFVNSGFVQSGQFLSIVPQKTRRLFRTDWPTETPASVGGANDATDPVRDAWQKWIGDNVDLVRPWTESGLKVLRADASRLEALFVLRRP